eukprot:11156432-Alexandrium_andersonii.AAC.1
MREALARPDRGQVSRSTLYSPTVTRTPLDEEGSPLEDKAATYQPTPASELSLPDGPSGQTVVTMLAVG